MTFDIINDLIEKYFAGETSLEEEQILRGYFTGSDIDTRLRAYAPLFRFFEKEKTIILADDKMPKWQEPKSDIAAPKLKILRGGYFWKMAAAVAFLVVASVAIFKTFEKTPSAPVAHHKAKIIILDGEDDPEVALQKVNEALALVSKKMKKGTDETTNGLVKLRDATDVLHKQN